MKNYDWAGCKVEVDEIATREWYAQAEEWGCECGRCRNYLAVADKLPEQLLSLLKTLGIPLHKALHVSTVYFSDEELERMGRPGGHLLYLIEFRLAGRILERPEQNQPEPWGLDVCYISPFIEADFPEPFFDIMVSGFLPWVLDEPING